MRVKKQKRHRKTVRFYSSCFGFRMPYKILCDGTFIHHLLAHRIVDHRTHADIALRRVLGGRVILFASSCVVAELRALGESYSLAYEAARQLLTARCDHEKRVSAASCIESIIGNSNSEHFFVASQDADLRRKFREIPGVPVIYGLRNALFIDQPSTQQREFVRSSEEKRLNISESEYLKLYKKVPTKKETSHLIESTSIHDDSANKLATSSVVRNVNSTRQMLSVADENKVKLKKAKGPNPLSCKKKQLKEGPSVSDNQDGTSSGTTKRKRNRKRKRSHQDSNLLESEAKGAGQ